MNHHASSQWLIVYDIADKKRLARVFKMLKKSGVPIQYSVFMVNASTVTVGALMAKISDLIDKQADDVRAYRLPDNGWSVTIGSSILPEGVLPDNRTTSKSTGLGQEHAPTHDKRVFNPLSELIFFDRAI